ncbi:hypothetical protein DFP73DRAFT_616657 [Morchella snyderi]|nr:hypothetical protein DFP73DRAFT_616657 [Morchella snyderi]
MAYYAAQNPYRNSTGGLNLGRSPPRTQILVPVRPPSPADSTCSSCDSSLPLNTPWSGSGTQLDQTERVCTRTRRLSTHSEGRHSDGRHMDGHHNIDGHHDRGRPAPLIIRQGGGPGPLSAPLAQHRGYRSDRSAQTLIVPASSIDRHRSASRSRSGYTKYHHAIEHFNDESLEVGSVGSDVGRRGRTRFPHRLVSKEAVEEMGLPWSEESDGALVVLRALDRTEIERLVDLTGEIRRRRSGSGKSVSFNHKAIIHDPIPYAPTPPPVITEQRVVHHYTGERPTTPITSENIAHLNQGQNSFSHVTTTTTTTTTEEPILIPIIGKSHGATKTKTTYTTPSFPLPQDSLSRAEEKAIRAEEKAHKLSIVAKATGNAKDEHDAYKARVKADEKRRKFEDKEWKERVKRDEKEIRHRDERETTRTTKVRRGESVVIR